MSSPNASPPNASPASARRILAVFHLGDVSGPAKSMRPRLEALAQEGTLELVVPAEGSLPRLYGDAHRVRVLPYEPLTVPRGPLEGLRALRRFRREVRRFRGELRRARPDLVVIVTAVLPAALLAWRACPRSSTSGRSSRRVTWMDVCGRSEGG